MCLKYEGVSKDYIKFKLTIMNLDEASWLLTHKLLLPEPEQERRLGLRQGGQPDLGKTWISDDRSAMTVLAQIHDGPYPQLREESITTRKVKSILFP